MLPAVKKAWVCIYSQFCGCFVTRNPAGYCFVEFASSEAAQRAMLKLNNKIIPGSAPVCDALQLTF